MFERFAIGCIVYNICATWPKRAQWGITSIVFPNVIHPKYLSMITSKLAEIHIGISLYFSEQKPNKIQKEWHFFLFMGNNASHGQYYRAWERCWFCCYIFDEQKG